MTSEEVKTARLQRVVSVVETILTEIAEENSAPSAAVLVMSGFLMDLTLKIGKISTERLTAFLNHKLQPDD